MTKIDEILKRKPFVMSITHAYINLTDMSIDEIDSNSDVELDDNDLRYWDYHCSDCENERDDYHPREIKAIRRNDYVSRNITNHSYFDCYLRGFISYHI